MGKRVARQTGGHQFNDVALELNALLRQPPDAKLIENALLHMWGYVSGYSPASGEAVTTLPKNQLLTTIQQLALANEVNYLLESTALSELCAWKF